MDRIIIFGCGPTGLRTYGLLKSSKRVVAFLDNDRKKAGSKIEGIPVYIPDKIVLENLEFDYIVIASVYGDREIREQLREMGVTDDKMIARPTMPNVLPTFLKNLAEDFAEENVLGACAEVGVFRGVSAAEINRFFPARELHLYDTFEGFSQNDIEIEIQIGRQDAEKGQFSDTSVDIVMNLMENPEHVFIHKGYFPDTAKGLKQQFCFVRIDVDLYVPTKAALDIFAPLMIRGGNISA